VRTGVDEREEGGRKGRRRTKKREGREGKEGNNKGENEERTQTYGVREGGMTPED
jgi:hypothetical protein